MWYRRDRGRGASRSIRGGASDVRGRLLADGGETGDTDGEDDERPDEAAEESPVEATDENSDEAADESTEGDTPGGRDHPEESNVEISDEVEPAEPKWEKPDLDDIPEFELRAEGPVTKGPDPETDRAGSRDSRGGSDDPGAGMPNTARSPEATRISSEGTEAFIVALEMCVRLPEEVRLPEQAAELVPAAVEAELEQDVQQFAAAEFGTQTPHVDVLTFESVDDEIWLRLRLGLPTEGFRDLDPKEIRAYALEELEGMF